MKITAIPFTIGTAIPPLVGLVETYDFFILSALIMGALVLTKQVKLL